MCMYFKTLPNHTSPGFDEQGHFNQFGKANIIFNASSSASYCDNHVGCLSIKTVLEGEEWYGVNGRMLAVRPGQFLILNDQQEYSCRIEDTTARTISIFFKTELAQSIFNDVRSSEVMSIDDPEFSGHTPEFYQRLRDVDAILQKQLQELIGSLEINGYQQNDVDEQLIGLLQSMLRSHGNDLSILKHAGATKASTKKEIFKRISIARDMILSNPGDNIDLKTLSKVACLSVPQLVRQFKNIFCVSPHQFLTSVRLRRANELLKTTDRPVAEIAALCGYENTSAFCRAFKTMFKTNANASRMEGP